MIITMNHVELYMNILVVTMKRYKNHNLTIQNNVDSLT